MRRRDPSGHVFRCIPIRASYGLHQSAVERRALSFCLQQSRGCGPVSRGIRTSTNGTGEPRKEYQFQILVRLAGRIPLAVLGHPRRPARRAANMMKGTLRRGRCKDGKDTQEDARAVAVFRMRWYGSWV